MKVIFRDNWGSVTAGDVAILTETEGEKMQLQTAQWAPLTSLFRVKQLSPNAEACNVTSALRSKPMKQKIFASKSGWKARGRIIHSIHGFTCLSHSKVSRLKERNRNKRPNILNVLNFPTITRKNVCHQVHKSGRERDG